MLRYYASTVGYVLSIFQIRGSHTVQYPSLSLQLLSESINVMIKYKSLSFFLYFLMKYVILKEGKVDLLWFFSLFF